MRRYIKFAAIFMAVLMCLGIFGSAADAARKNKDRDPKKKQHPVAVIKGEVDRDGFDGGTTSVRRVCTLWVKNLGRDDMDKVKVKMKVYDNRRLLEEKEEEIEDLEAGSRVFVNFRWEDFSRSSKQRIEIWLTYTNDEGEEVTYQAPSPVW